MDIIQGQEPERIREDGDLVHVGEWYWLKMDADEKEEHLACVMEIGSNFAELKDPYGHSIRVHLDEFDKKCRRELHPEIVVRGQIEHYQGVVRQKLGEIQELTQRLGLSGSGKLEGPAAGGAPGTSLAVLSGTDNVKRYKQDLIQAKDKDLPKLFGEVKEANRCLATWMEAETMSLEGRVRGMEGCIEEVKDRIFNVSLYAGLTEEVEQVRKGEAAGIGEKLRIMQRLLYMDEECLLDYRHGGMEFKDIGEFDRWLGKPKNMDRALPFPRCLVAFRVRRSKKERDWGGDLMSIVVNVGKEDADKATFLYIRNGGKLYRMDCDLEFDELIFPGRHEMDLTEPMVAKMGCSKVDDMIPRREWEDRRKAWEEGHAKHKAWQKEHPKEDSYNSPFFEHRWDDDRLSDYKPFDKANVYYDEMLATIEKRVQYYNRISLIVQGLYDRSEVLHPHPPVKLWSQEGFMSAVELVYDGTNTLSHGEPPNFEAYMAKKNKTLKAGCVTVGQDDFWQENEAKKESARMDRSRFVRGHWRPSRHKPYGNDGPGYLGKVVEWTPRSRKALYTWKRERRTENYWAGKERGDLVPTKIWVPDTRIFNVSAYNSGEYLQFFQDPRTRAKYMKWAPMLLAAEDFHAGKLKISGE